MARPRRRGAWRRALPVVARAAEVLRTMSGLAKVVEQKRVGTGWQTKRTRKKGSWREAGGGRRGLGSEREREIDR
eukprot:2590138-Pleurochrysis_carterae.AAC.1